MTNENAANSSGNDKIALLEKYTKPRFGPLTKSQPVATPQPSDDTDAPGDGSYRGLIKYRGRRSSSRFRIVDRKGVSYGCGYAYMLGWLFTPPATLSIQTTTHQFIFGGTNLHVIEDALLREVVMELREFRPGEDTLPPEGEPVIDHLEVVDRFKEREKAI